jgi:predicted secreted protein
VSAVVGTSELFRTILLPAHSTLLTVALAALARVTLSTDTNPITDLDAAGHLRPNTNSGSNELVANTNGIQTRSLWSKG